MKTKDGKVGFSALQGTVDLGGLIVSEAAKFCRETISQDVADWLAENPESTDELYFCITVDLDSL